MTNILKVLIVEDEELLARNLELALKEVDSEVTIMTILDSVSSAVKWLSSNTPDLIFLDIQLSDGLSFEIFQKVKIETPVIFLTAYDQYAIRAFKLNSIDYLLKPLNIQELKSALIKFRKQLVQKSQGDEFVKLIDLLQHKEPSYRKRFVVYVAEKIKYIETENVAYFFIIEGETFFRDFEGNNYPCDFSLDKLASELDPAIFFRVNRQYTINLKAIKHMYNLTKSSIKIDLNPRPDEEVFVSLSRSGDFKRWLNQ